MVPIDEMKPTKVTMEFEIPGDHDIVLAVHHRLSMLCQSMAFSNLRLQVGDTWNLKDERINTVVAIIKTEVKE